MDTIDPGILALAGAIAFFVVGAVDIVKKVAGRSRHRRWLLPIAGVLLGWTFAGLLVVYREEPLSPKTVAAVILAGMAAAILAGMKADQSQRADRTNDNNAGRG